MKTLRLALAAVLIAPLLAGAVAVSKAEPAQAETDLGDLIVTNGLFGNNNAEDLAGLIAVDSITGGDSMGGTSDLEELIVLGGLFDSGWGNDAEDLAGLIAVDNIF